MQSAILFCMIIHDLDDRVKCTHSKCADDTKWGGGADRAEHNACIQRDLDCLEKCADRKQGKFSKGMCKDLHFVKNNPKHQNVLGATSKESSWGSPA